MSTEKEDEYWFPDAKNEVSSNEEWFEDGRGVDNNLQWFPEAETMISNRKYMALSFSTKVVVGILSLILVFWGYQYVVTNFL